MRASLFYISILLTLSSLCLGSFQISFLKEINKYNKNKNFVFSPMSIYQILSLTANGARGNTLHEMVKALSGNSITELNRINSEILNAAKNFTSIEIANAIMTRIEPLDEFKKIAYSYDATIEKLKSADQVNSWCFLKTHGKILQIVDQLDPLTKMILLNAIYFKGTWKNKFKPEKTQKKYFYNFGEQTKPVQVNMMNLETKFNYYSDEKVQVIEIPFSKDSVSAVIFLPQKLQNINDFIAELDDQKIKKYLNSLFPITVDLELPKFKIEFESGLNTYLHNLGMKQAFSPMADLSGLAKGGNDLYIDSVIQKAFIEVDESGAEAAAVTAVIINGWSSIINIRQRMYVNRPFLMMLRSKALPEDNDVLFMAKIEELNLD
jgi:serpin B